MENLSRENIKPISRPTPVYKPPPNIKKILWVRPDSIGDAVLAASMLPHIKKKFKKAEIHVICQTHLYDIYAACPYVTEVIGFNQEKLLIDPHYRQELVNLLESKRYDISINSVYSKQNVTDFLSINTSAQIKIAHIALPSTYTEMSAVNLYNNSHEIVVSTPEKNMLELDRHQLFVKYLGCNIDKDLTPLIWIPPHVEMYAKKIFKKNNLEPSNTIVLAAGVQFSQRLYDHYCEALESLCKEKNLTLILVGVEKDRPVINNNLRNFTGKTVDLVGNSILEMAAIIKRARMLVGGDSGAAHIACAVKTPNAIVLGGGHYRRFFPYSSLTYCAVLHLDCFGCSYHCKFDRPYCVQGVLPQTLEKAVRGAFELSDKRIYFQESL